VNFKIANSGTLESSTELPSPRKPLHVLALTPFYPSAGDEVNGCFIAEMIRELKQETVASDVMAVGAWHHPQRISSESSPAEWLRFPRVPGNFGLSSSGHLLYLRLRTRVQRVHQQHPVDLIHAHSALPCGDAARLLSNELGVPFVVSVHGLDAFNSCFVEGVSAGWRRKASCEVYAQARSVICVSHKVEQVIRTGVRSARTAVVYNGTDTRLFSPDPSVARESGRILVVGNLIRSKGQELVLRAAATLRHSHPELQCSFIGDGRDREWLAELARGLGIEDRVSFHGRRSRLEVAQAMRSAALFVLPSNNEALGCVYLEAMASGVPVIACRGQGIDEIIEHQKNGWLIGSGNLEDLVQGMSTLLENPGMRTEIAATARNRILDGLTMTDQASRMRALYEDAVS